MTGTMAKRKTGWAKRLADMREDEGLTQADAAAKLPVALRTWINWEAGHQEPSNTAQELLKIRFPKHFK